MPSALDRPWWINKTPELPRFGAELFSAVGPCRVILLIRDGVDVVASARRLGWASVEQLATWWRLLIEDSRRAAERAPIDYCELRFEDLVRAPERVVDEALRFLQMPGSGSDLVARYDERMRHSKPAPPPSASIARA